MDTLALDLETRPKTLAELKAAALQREMIQEQEQERQHQADAFAAKLNWDKLVEFVKTDLHLELLVYADLEIPAEEKRFTARTNRYFIPIRLPGHAEIHAIYQRAGEGERWLREKGRYTDKPYWRVASYGEEYNQYGNSKHVAIRWDEHSDLGAALLEAERNYAGKLEAETTVKEHNANLNRQNARALELEQAAQSEPLTRGEILLEALSAYIGEQITGA